MIELIDILGLRPFPMGESLSEYLKEIENRKVEDKKRKEAEALLKIEQEEKKEEEKKLKEFEDSQKKNEEKSKEENKENKKEDEKKEK